MSIYERAGLTIAGLATRTTNQAEADASSALIGTLYQRFFAANIDQQLVNANPTSRYAVYTNYASDNHGAYDVILGHEVKPDQLQPTGFTQVTIPAQRYQCWQATLAQPSDVQQLWVQINHYFSQPQPYQRSYTADFEYYDLSNPLAVEIWIAIH